MKVVEYTDAMCSWAWGTEPKLRLLRWRFEDQIGSWRVVMGHLVEDEHMPDRDPVAGAPKLEEYWKVVCDMTGMPRPAPLNRTTRGSRASGLAVKAAQSLESAHGADPSSDGELAQRVLRRMREATFVHGEPPDTPERAIHAGRGIDALDAEALLAAMESDDVADSYAADYESTRSPNDHVLELEGDRPGIGRARDARDGRKRFVFPTLVITGVVDGDPVERTVPGWMPYEDYEQALFDTGAKATQRTRSNPTPAEAMARWPTLAQAELAFLCGDDATPPADSVTHTWTGGTFHIAPGEASALGL